MSDRLITVAIHTYDRALALKSLLEREGVEVTLQNVNLSNPVVSAGVRVRIHETDLPMALRIIENKELFTNEINEPTEEKPVILVPIDFSDYSTRACEIAFRLAARHRTTITLLHSYNDPFFTNRIQLNDDLTYETPSDTAETRIEAERAARQLMDNFSNRLISKIKSGELPVVKFNSVITDGIPEECINNFAKDHSPMLIVMGTRGADTKERELVGSVTAEVLDTCRVPVFTVPDSVDIHDCSLLTNVILFSNFDQEDILALDALFRLLPDQTLNVTLVKIPYKKRTQVDNESLNALGTYCTTHYPDHKFAIDTLSISSVDADFTRITAERNVNLIAVPNKKKNIFARLFNPGIAHRLLFHSDIPMMVIPV